MRLVSLVSLSLLLIAPRARAQDTAAADGPTKKECIAANERAQDLQSAGKLQSAKQALLGCMHNSCPGPVREDCAARLEEVNKAQPSIVFEVKDADGNDLDRVQVTMDGYPLVNRLDGKAVEIDPGKHRFRFETSGADPVEKSFVIREGEKARVEKIVLGRPRVVEPPPPPPPPPPDRPPLREPDKPKYVPAPPPPEPPSKSRWPYGRSAFTLGVAVGVEMRLPLGDFGDYMDTIAPSVSGEKIFGGDMLANMYLRLYQGLMIGGFGGVRLGPSYRGSDFKGLLRVGGSLRYDFVSIDENNSHTSFYLAAHGGMTTFSSGTLCSTGDSGLAKGVTCPPIMATGGLFGGELGLEGLFKNHFGIGLFTRFWYGKAEVKNKDTKQPLTDSTGATVPVNLSGWEIIGMRLMFGI